MKDAKQEAARPLRFTEAQAFPSWSYTVLLFVGVGPLLLARLLPDPAKPIIAPTGIVTALVMAILANLLYLRTTVDDEALVVIFGYAFPMYRQRIPLGEIRSAEAVTYNPLREYGGWGIRGFGDNRALNARGNRGVRLTLTDGRRLLVGSQRPDELATALRAGEVGPEVR